MVSDSHHNPIGISTSHGLSLPAISVCIPTLNGASTISESVQSVLVQSFTNFELIISDDGSSDETIGLLSRFNDPRILVVSGPASGSADQNWNHVIGLARGQFVKVMGQDDILYPGALEAELSMFARYSGMAPVMTFSQRDLLSPKGCRLPRILSHRSRFTTPSNLGDLLPRIVRSGRNPLGEPVCVTAKRETLREIGGFKGSYLIDLTTWIRLLEFGPGLFINSPQCGFRISRGSWSYALRRSQAHQTREFIRTLRIRFPDSVSRLDVIIGSINATLAQASRLIVLSILSKKKKVRN